MADLSNDEILDLVKKHESGGLNVTNYMYDPTHTAQGYYQITNTNWSKIAPQVGVDLKKYPNAMAAPEAEQRRVADYLLNNTPKGAKNWESPTFRKAAGITEEDSEPTKMADAQDTKKDPNDLSGLSDEDLAKQIAELKGQIQTSKTPPPAKPAKKPSTMEQFATTPDIGNLPPLPQFPGADWVSNVTIPGIKQMIRGAQGYKLPGQTDYSEAGKIADVGEGALKTFAPLGFPAAAAAPAAAALTLGLGTIGDFGARKGAELFGADEDQQRVAGLIGGLVAGGAHPLLKGRMPSIGSDLNLGTRAQGAFEAFGPSERRVGGIRKLFTGEAPKGKVEAPTQKYPSPSAHEDMISTALSGPERIEARAKMVDSLKAQNYSEEDAIRMADNAFRKAESADDEKLRAQAEKNAPKPEKPAKITYQQMDRNVAAAPAQGRMALKQRYMEVLTSQGMPPDIAEQHFNTALTEAHQNDLELARKAEAGKPKGPSAKEFEDLKDMVKSGVLSSEDFQKQMAPWMSPDKLAYHAQDALSQRFSPGPQFKVQPQSIPAGSIPAQQGGAPQGLVQPPQGGFSQPMGVGSTGGEPSNLTKFKPQFGPVGPMHGPERAPFVAPEPEPPAEIPIASTKMVNNAARELFKGNYDLDKIPADNRDWRAEFRDKAKLGSIPTEKSVREAMGIARIMKAKVARGEKIPGIKIGRNEKGQWIKIEEP